MKDTIWNSNQAVTMKWHDFFDLYPGHNQKCLVVDIYGNMACCVYDSLLKEFHLLTEGVSEFDIRDSIYDIIDEVITKVSGNSVDELKDEILEEVIHQKATKYSGMFFDGAEHWMPLPPIPPSVASLADIAAESGEVKFLTYKVLDDIEHLITASIAKHLQDRNQEGAEQ